ncbi:hypothetical protein [Allofournierella sp. CML151]|uniref:hypothetical protein n=1 Tax=Allofournierella sp. CML151 TaxID=2998082 RepID=UPI0022EA1521|nr:hypothetical protein [Fournierella sp. CML151]
MTPMISPAITIVIFSFFKSIPNDPSLFLFLATPHNSRLTAQAAYHAKIFRAIFQKCSPSHQGLSVLFGSYHKKFPARSTTRNYAVPPFGVLLFPIIKSITFIFQLNLLILLIDLFAFPIKQL